MKKFIYPLVQRRKGEQYHVPQAWVNFVRANPKKRTNIIGLRNWDAILKEQYNAKITSTKAGFGRIVFQSEQDMMLFLLRYG